MFNKELENKLARLQERIEVLERNKADQDIVIYDLDGLFWLGCDKPKIEYGRYSFGSKTYSSKTYRASAAYILNEILDHLKLKLVFTRGTEDKMTLVKIKKARK